MSNGWLPESDAGGQRPRWDGRLNSRLRWTALVAALTATTLLVPPLVAPKHPARSTATPSPPAARPRSPSPSTPPSASPIGPSFTTVTLQASDPGNVRQGVHVFKCATCVGGDRVGYIGGANYLVIPVRVPVAGDRRLTVVYESDGQRTLMISVNGTTVSTLRLAGEGDWKLPATTAVPVFLPAGPSLLKFFNDKGPAPDVDRIVIS